MFDSAPVGHEVDLAARLLVAAVVGAIIGLARELHAHPAGTRTRLLVSVGAALFTIVSVFGFVGETGPVDPSRIAAQVVSGIGFPRCRGDHQVRDVHPGTDDGRQPAPLEDGRFGGHLPSDRPSLDGAPRPDHGA